MKLLRLPAAIALAATALTLPVAAMAQHHDDHGRDHSMNDRRHYNPPRRVIHRKVVRHVRTCRTEWRHHHRVRVCR